MAKKESDISCDKLFDARVSSLPRQEPPIQEISMSSYTDLLEQLSGIEPVPRPDPGGDQAVLGASPWRDIVLDSDEKASYEKATDEETTYEEFGDEEGENEITTNHFKTGLIIGDPELFEPGTAYFYPISADV